MNENVFYFGFVEYPQFTRSEMHRGPKTSTPILVCLQVLKYRAAKKQATGEQPECDEYTNETQKKQ